MKRDYSFTKTVWALITSAAMLTGAEAQTVLSGDHVVEGNLGVGTSVQKGGLTITGETGGAASPGIRVTGDGGVVFEGTGGTGAIPAEGQGTRLMWYPGKAAFRVGEFWDLGIMNSEIGHGSVAFSRSVAKESFSVAMSLGWAEGQYSTAMSYGVADGDHSTAMSDGWATGVASTAMSYGRATGIYSTAMSFADADGNSSTAMSRGSAYANYSTAMSGGWAHGNYSVAMSEGTALGDHSVAMNDGWADGAYSVGLRAAAVGDYSAAIKGGTALGFSSFAVGMDATTYGSESIAIGFVVVSRAYQCVTVGSYNAYSLSETTDSWVPTDPIFVVGNGEDSNSRSNAFLIRKNGDIEMMAKVSMPRQGDILMGEFGDPEP